MLPAQLTGLLSADQLKTLTGALTEGFTQGLQALGDPALNLNIGAIQASCTAAPRNANSTASLATTTLDIALPTVGGAAQQTIQLAKFESDPAPNTPISATPSEVLKALTASIQTSLTQQFDGLPAPIIALFGQLSNGIDQAKVIQDAVGMASDQLGPQLEQLISGTLNKQSRPDASSIDVTALDLNLLPAAAAATGSDLLDLQVGHVTCDAGTFKTAAVTKTPTPKSNVPTAIDSGLAGDDGRSPVLPIVGGLMLLAGVVIGVRRVLRTRG